MELNYTTYDNNIYNVTPMTMDTMNYEYIIDNLDNSMNTALCEPEQNNNIVSVKTKATSAVTKLAEENSKIKSAMEAIQEQASDVTSGKAQPP